MKKVLLCIFIFLLFYSCFEVEDDTKPSPTTGTSTSTTGGTSSSTSETISGVVLSDAYLSNALVFLDRNNNYQLDVGEETTFSVSTPKSGYYKISAPNAKQYSVVALVQSGTSKIGASTESIKENFVLASLPANSDVISPFSTLIKAETDAGFSSNSTEAANKIKNDIDLDSQVNLFSDYISSSDTNSIKLKRAAQLITCALAQNRKNIKSASSGAQEALISKVSAIYTMSNLRYAYQKIEEFKDYKKKNLGLEDFKDNGFLSDDLVEKIISDTSTISANSTLINKTYENFQKGIILDSSAFRNWIYPNTKASGKSGYQLVIKGFNDSSNLLKNWSMEFDFAKSIDASSIYGGILDTSSLNANSTYHYKIKGKEGKESLNAKEAALVSVFCLSNTFLDIDNLTVNFESQSSDSNLSLANKADNVQVVIKEIFKDKTPKNIGRTSGVLSIYNNSSNIINTWELSFETNSNINTFFDVTENSTLSTSSSTEGLKKYIIKNTNFNSIIHPKKSIDVFFEANGFLSNSAINCQINGNICVISVENGIDFSTGKSSNNATQTSDLRSGEKIDSAVIQSSITYDLNYKKIIAHYIEDATYEKNFQIGDINGINITHLIYGPLVAKDDGTVCFKDKWAAIERLHPGDSWSDTIRGNIGQIEKLKKKYPHLKVLLSIGGWKDSNNFSDIFANSTYRNNFVQSCAALTSKYTFIDGFNIDWQFPLADGHLDAKHSTSDINNYLLLINELKAKLSSNTIITITGTGKVENVKNTRAKEFIDKGVNWINVIAYDYYGPWSNYTNHHAPLYLNRENPESTIRAVDFTIREYASLNIPFNQIVPVFSLKGRQWSQIVDPINLYTRNAKDSSFGTWDNDLTGKRSAFDYWDIEKLANKTVENQYKSKWDAFSKNTYLYNTYNKYFISYEDKDSMTEKLNYILSSQKNKLDSSGKEIGVLENAQLGGIAFLNISADKRQSEGIQYSNACDSLVSLAANKFYGVTEATTFAHSPMTLKLNNDIIEALWKNDFYADSFLLSRYESGATSQTNTAEVYDSHFIDDGVISTMPKPNKGSLYCYSLQAKKENYDGTYKTQVVGGNTSCIGIPLKQAVPSISLLSNASGFLLSWGAVEGAASYEVARASDTSFSAGTLFKTTLSSGTYQYQDLHGQGDLGKQYFFKIKANAKDSQFSSESGIVSGTFGVGFSTLEINSIQSQDNDVAVTLAWNKDNTADSYQLARQKVTGTNNAVSAFEYANIGSFSSTDKQGASLFATDLEPASTYIYKVRPIKVIDNISFYGYFSNTKSVTTNLKSTASLNLKNVETGIVLTWSQVAGSENYRVTRREQGDTNSTNYLNATISNPSILYYYDTKESNPTNYLAEGKTYEYMLRASNLSKSVYSLTPWMPKFYGADFTNITPEITKCSGSASNINIEWRSFSSAYHYKLCRGETSGSYTSTSCKNLNGGSYTDKAYDSIFGVLKYGQKYFYKISVGKKSDDKVFYSSYSAEKDASINYPSNTITLSLQNTTTLKISWNAIDNEGSYLLRRKIGTSGAWTNLASGNIHSHSDSVEQGKTYYYNLQICNQDKSICNETTKDFTYNVDLDDVNITSITQNQDASYIKIGWTTDTKASYYNLYRKKNQSGSTVYSDTITKLTGNSFTDYLNPVSSPKFSSNIVAGVKYDYKLEAVREVDNVQTASKSKEVIGWLKMANPYLKIKNLDANSDGKIETLQLNWLALSGAESYTIKKARLDNSKIAVVLPAVSIPNPNLNIYADSSDLLDGSYYTYDLIAIGPQDASGSRLESTSSKTIKFEHYFGLGEITLTSNKGNIVDPAIKLSWNKDDMADYYRLCRKKSADTLYSYCLKIDKVATSSTMEFMDNDEITKFIPSATKRGEKLDYKLQAIRNIGDSSFYREKEEKTYLGVQAPIISSSMPFAFTWPTSDNNDFIKVFWSKIDDATSYTLLRYSGESGNSSPIEIKGILTNSYLDQGFLNSIGTSDGTIYVYYKVKAVSQDSVESAESNQLGLLYPRNMIPMVITSITKASDSSIALGWTSDPNATKYKIFRTIKEGWDIFEGQSDITSFEISAPASSTIDTNGINKGAEYCYRIRAAKVGSLGTTWGPYADKKCVQIPIDQFTSSDFKVAYNGGSDKIELDFKNISGATKYTIYRFSDAQGNTQIGNKTWNSPLSSTAFNLSNNFYKYVDDKGELGGTCETGKKYYYKVEAVGADERFKTNSLINGALQLW